MHKRIQLIACGFLSALIIAMAVPVTTNAGTLTIYNENCTHLKGFKRKKSVTVHVFAQDDCDTNTKVTVRQGSSKTITLDDYYNEKDHMSKDGKIVKGDPTTCKYAYEARGTVSFTRDVRGDRDSSVTCKRDWARVCQCTKD